MNMEKILNNKMSGTLNARVTGILAYMTWIGWIVAYLIGDRDGAKYHLNQSLVLLLSNVIVTLVGHFGSAASLLSEAAMIGLGFLWLTGFSYAFKGENKEIPVLGSIHILN